MDPLENTDHEYTLILLHGLNDTALGFYKWINQTFHHFFGDSDNFNEESDNYDLFKHCRIVLPQTSEKFNKLWNDQSDQEDLLR